MKRLTLLLLLLSTPAYAENYFRGPWVWSDQCVASTGGCWHPPVGASSGVDLRTLPQQASKVGGGDGIFVSDLAAIPGYQKLTSAQAQNVLWQMMTVDSDPEGLVAPKPIMPDSDGVVRLKIGVMEKSEHVDFSSDYGQKVKQVMKDTFDTMPDEQGKRYLGSVVEQFGFNPVPNVTPKQPHTSVSDNFNRADGSLGSAWSVVSGTFVISSNQYQQTDGGVNGFARYETDLSSTDFYAQVSYVTLPGSGQGGVGADVRFSSSANTHYGGIAYRVAPATDYKIVWKWVAGTRTDLVNTTTTLPSAPFDVKIDVVGSSITLYHGGSSVSSTTDSSITSGTRAGIYGFQSGTTIPGDNFYADDGLSSWTGRRPYVIL